MPATRFSPNAMQSARIFGPRSTPSCPAARSWNSRLNGSRIPSRRSEMGLIREVAGEILRRHEAFEAPPAPFDPGPSFGLEIDDGQCGRWKLGPQAGLGLTGSALSQFHGEVLDSRIVADQKDSRRIRRCVANGTKQRRGRSLVDCFDAVLRDLAECVLRQLPRFPYPPRG